MRNIRTCFITLLCVLCLVTAVAEGGFEVVSPDSVIVPGESVLLGFYADHDGLADLYVTDAEGERVSVVALALDAKTGLNQLYWNGTWQGESIPEGEYLLTAEMDGETASTSITVALPGAAAQPTVPQTEHNELGWEDLQQDETNLPTEDTAEIVEETVEITEEITDDDSDDDRQSLAVSVYGEAEDGVFTPSYGSPYPARAEEEGSYWTLPMDITDTEKVWEMLMRPITVADTGKKNAQKTQLKLYLEPDQDSRVVGVVTCVTQSLRVLEKGDEWTLVETYSSTFHDNGIGAWNMLVQGYIQTKYLKTTKPNEHMAFVADKLTQRLYIFVDGELYDTLLISTGLANERQPYNETRSGEFLLQVPAVGGFMSDALICDLGIRFNDGDLLHEVPHVLNSDGTKNYKSCEPKLGTRASHGCIRVQRQKTPKGTNMQWIWSKKANNMKFVLWEDWQGRQIAYPDDDTPVYYNPDRGEMYHSAETCYSAKNRTFQPFTYGQLDDEGFSKLRRCTYCNPPMRKAEIDAINEEHAEGGDHDPILTAAREKWLSSLDN